MAHFTALGFMINAVLIFAHRNKKLKKNPTTTPTTTNPSLLSMDEDKDYDISDIAAEQVQRIIHNYV